MAWNPDDNDVYYRVLLRNGKYLVATLQWFDEYDYDHSEYATDERFETEELAREWIDSQWEIGPMEELILSKLPANDFTKSEQRQIVRATLEFLYRENGVSRNFQPRFPHLHFYADDLKEYAPLMHDGGRVRFSLSVAGQNRPGHAEILPPIFLLHYAVKREKGSGVSMAVQIA